jgi:hypothetical protein
VVVHLHRGIEGVRAEPFELWMALSSGSRRIDVAGVSADVPGEPALALILALHAAHHGRHGGKLLEELRRAVERAGLETWRQALQLAERLEAVPSFAAGLRLVPEGAALAERLWLPVDGDRETALRAAGAHSTAIGFARLAATPGVRAKVALVARKLVPTPAFIMRHWSRLVRWGAAGPCLGLRVAPPLAPPPPRPGRGRLAMCAALALYRSDASLVMVEPTQTDSAVRRLCVVPNFFAQAEEMRAVFDERMRRKRSIGQESLV